MNGVDTNVLVYGVGQSDPVKHVKAVMLLASLVVSAAEAVLLWQVAGEFLQTLRRMECWGSSVMMSCCKRLPRHVHPSD